MFKVAFKMSFYTDSIERGAAGCVQRQISSAPSQAVQIIFRQETYCTHQVLDVSN